MTASPDDDGKPTGRQGGATVTPRSEPGKPGASGATGPTSPSAAQASAAPAKPGPAGSSALAGSGTQTRSGTEPVKAEPSHPGDKAGEKPGAPPAKPDTPAGATTAAKPGTPEPPRASTTPPASGAGAAGPKATEPTKTGSANPGAKVEPAKVEPGKFEPGKSEPSKAEAVKAEPVKAAATGSTPIPPVPPASGAGPKVDTPAKTAATGSSALGGGAKPETTKPEATKPGSGASGATGGASPGATGTGASPQGTTRVKPEDRLTDGPILDIKSGRPADPKAAGRETGKDPKDGKANAGAAAASAGAASTGAAARGGPGYGTVAASGLVGGAVGAGLLYLLAANGALVPKTDTTRLDALDKRIAALATNESVTALDKRVAANAQALQPLPEAVGRAEAAAKTATERADQALQKSAAAPTGSGEAKGDASGEAKPVAGVPADLVARLDALDQRVSALQEEPGREPAADPNKPTTTQNGDQSVRLADVDERLKALETKAQAQGAPAVPEEDLAPKVAALQGDLDSRAKANEAADKALGERLDKLQQSLESRVQANTEAVQQVTQASRKTAEAEKQQADEAAKAVDRRLQEQGDRIAALDKAVDGSAKAATMQAALRVVALDRITDALDAGTPYADALGTLRGSDPGDGARYEPLAAFADNGAPTAAAFAAEFRLIADKVAAERRAAKARETAQTGGLGDRLMSMAESMVQVKRVPAGGTATSAGAPAAATPDEPEAAVQDALDRGQVTEAAKAFDALPEAVRAPAKTFGDRLKAVAAARGAARDLQSDAFKGLAAPAAAR